jgi:hypothetical protein
MKHPSEYTTVPFFGFHVMVVDAGTVIKDERTGQEATVDDEAAVFKGKMIYCTKPIYDGLAAHTEKLPY